MLAILYPTTAPYNYLVSIMGGDYLKNMYCCCSWTNVARPCFLLKKNPTRVKLGSISFSAEGQLVFCSRIICNMLFKSKPIFC